MAIGFAVAFLIALEITFQYDPTSPNRLAFLWLGSILGALSIVTFLSSGSRFVLLASVLSYGHLVLVAAPAIYIGIGEGQLRSYLDSSYALLFLSLVFVVQIGLFVFSPSVPPPGSRKFSINESFQIWAMALLVLSFVANRVGGLVHAFESLALAAVVLSSLVTFTRPTIGRAVLNGMCLLLILGVYSMYVFDGYGRLELASYVLCVGVIFSWIFNSLLPKIATVFASVPAYFLMTIRRVETVEQTQGVQISANDTLVSVFGPFQSGAYILQQAMIGEISPTHGQSWLTSLLFWVPKRAWPEKPPGFGRAIVPLTQPHNVQIPHHSDAAPYLAEFVWDFGLYGLLLIPVLVWLVRRSDRWIVQHLLCSSGWLGIRNPALLAACLAAITGMMINFAWGASFTFISRTAIPASMLFGLYWWSAKMEYVPHAYSESDGRRAQRSTRYVEATLPDHHRLPSQLQGGVDGARPRSSLGPPEPVK